MKTYNEKIVHLIGLALSGELEEAEYRELEAWCREKKENREFYDTLCRENNFSLEYPLYLRIDEEKAMQRFSKAIDQKNRKHRLFKHITRYAALLILPLLVVAVWQWTGQQQPKEGIPQAIDPGSSKAVLTLAGGRQVNLGGDSQQAIEVRPGIRITSREGLLSYDDSQARSGTQQMEYNTLSTGRGGEYCLVLADGTKVFLNAATTLKYPVVFKGEIRKVELEGEAYFEVAKDTAHAFIVETQGMEVKVYGTSFNLNTLTTNKVRTVLVEGSIGIRTAGSEQEYRVRPGQMAVWNQADGTLELQEVDVTLYTDWKNGIFRFNQEKLEDILTTLSNWYDVEVFYRNQEIKHLHFSGYMERYEQIGTILDAITEATGVQFSIQGKTILVSK